ncbi:MAG: GNAT family N-acetyltransferase [Gammaproteobacteria bacterium]|nr:GNAT family N-acetyltransferase [Gammaproteobacteria bacterium]
MTQKQAAFRLRRATASDFPAMLAITHAALRQLATPRYRPQDIEEAIATGAWTLHESLLVEGRYFVAADDQGVIVGGGGWNRDWLGPADEDIGQPEYMAALRAMFVNPQRAGQGIGSMLLEHILADIDRQGIAVTELFASFDAEPLYARFGFETLCLQSLHLESGAIMKGTRMRRVRP